MTTKELTTTGTSALAIRDERPLNEILAENLGDMTLDPADFLQKIHVPSGGGLFWTYTDYAGQEIDTKEVRGTVIHTTFSRAYWSQRLEDGGTTPPDCSSKDAVMGRSRTAEDGSFLLWETQGGCQACPSCPFAQFGSATNGKGQACKLSQHLYLRQPGDDLPLVLTLPPTSLGQFKDFAIKQSIRRVALTAVNIGFALEKVESGGGIKYSKLRMSLDVRPLSAEEYAEMRQYREGFVRSLAGAMEDAA